MGRYRGPKNKLSRREGIDLFSTGGSQLQRRIETPPGVHGSKPHRGRPSDFSRQLREKQKVKRIYGVFEAQFRRYFALAERSRGVTGETLLTTLERRLDNIVFRLSFANSRAEARQLVRHGHFKVNGRKVTIPSFLVNAGDKVTVRERSQKVARIVEALELSQRRGVPDWLEIDREGFTGTVKMLPQRADLTMPINERLIVELYSK